MLWTIVWIFFYYTYDNESENNSNIADLFPQHPHKVAFPFYREHRGRQCIHKHTGFWLAEQGPKSTSGAHSSRCKSPQEFSHFLIWLTTVSHLKLSPLVCDTVSLQSKFCWARCCVNLSLRSERQTQLQTLRKGKGWGGMDAASLMQFCTWKSALNDAPRDKHGSLELQRWVSCCYITVRGQGKGRLPFDHCNPTILPSRVCPVARHQIFYVPLTVRCTQKKLRTLSTW